MTWTLSVPKTKRIDIYDALEDAKPVGQDEDNVRTERDEQVDAAKQAVLRILRSGAFGGAERYFNVSMSGHANPKHEPLYGWGNDYLNITISQAEEKPN